MVQETLQLFKDYQANFKMKDSCSLLPKDCKDGVGVEDSRCFGLLVYCGVLTLVLGIRPKASHMQCMDFCE